MELIQQPTGTPLCGQCVIAMLAGITLEEAVAAMGQKRNYPANMKKAAAKFGLSMPSRSVPGSVIAPEGRGAAMIWGKKQHWVCWDNGSWFDPAASHLLSDLTHYDAQAIALYPISHGAADAASKP